MFGFGNGKINKTQMYQVPVEDAALIGTNLATFAIACITGGATGDAALITANNLVVKEVRAYGEWKSKQLIVNAADTQLYLSEMNLRIFQELKQLAAIAPALAKKEESNGGPTVNAGGDGKENAGAGEGNSKPLLS